MKSKQMNKPANTKEIHEVHLSTLTSLQIHLWVHQLDDVTMLEAEQCGLASQVILHCHHKLVALQMKQLINSS